MLKGNTAIVTGGSRGIGAAIAKKLASLGANVALLDIGNEDQAKLVCEYCTEEFGVKAAYYSCNVADFEQTKQVVTQVSKDFENVTILINNAGITRDGLVMMMNEKQFDDVISVNLKGAFNMIKHCSRQFMKNKCGRIVNISSVSGLSGNAGQANYSASKAGLVGLTKTVAREFASKNITCNAIAPGFIATDMTADISAENNPLAAQIPLGRPGTPEDIAGAAAFLVTSPYVTGVVLRVDGGLGM
ncbi:3-oxoacyl-[acyl-carrier-protein] reductase [Ruminococcaceae bacterium FB2012]|nr:3-oxoacyl-[acyl-carrier-protein] reductase [Ruminococcaceae bacterium FB2012]